jgi:hypothetical protein
MRGLLSIIVVVCFSAIAAMATLGGPVRPVGHGGIDVVLVPFGDDSGVSH